MYMSKNYITIYSIYLSICYICLVLLKIVLNTYIDLNHIRYREKINKLMDNNSRNIFKIKQFAKTHLTY